jgi:hypothetical protein
MDIHCILVHYITLHYITLHYITLITLHYTTLHYINYITLHYITLHYTALHSMAPKQVNITVGCGICHINTKNICTLSVKPSHKRTQ